MSVTFGFYNSINSDRKYDAVQVSSIFDGIIRDGVFSTIGDSLMVSPNGGLNIQVGIGRAWFNHTWTYNDASLILSLDPPDAILPRTDAIILEIDSDDNVRTNTITIVKGTPSTGATRPVLENTATKHQYPLAYILLPAGPPALEIASANITNMVGTAECPFVTGPLSQVTTNDLLAQWEGEFTEWFDRMKGQLSEDAAGNLQMQIDPFVGDHTLDDNSVPVSTASPLMTLLNYISAAIKRITGKASWFTAPAINLETLKTHNHSGGNGNQIIAAGIANGTIDSTKIAANAIINGLIANDAITSAKIANYAVSSGKIAARSVGSSEIINRSIIPAHLAFQVMALLNRKGGSDTSWITPGVNNQAVGDVRMCAGVQTYNASGTNWQNLIITFPFEFSAAPIVIPVSMDCDVNVSVFSTNYAGAELQFRKVTAGNIIQGNVIWIAIGDIG